MNQYPIIYTMGQTTGSFGAPHSTIVGRIACGVGRIACGVSRIACGVGRIACGVGRIARGVILAALCLLAGDLMLASTPALASAKYAQASSFGAGGTMSLGPGVAINQINGEVLVADETTVQRFSPIDRANPSSGYTQGSPLVGSFQRSAWRGSRRLQWAFAGRHIRRQCRFRGGRQVRSVRLARSDDSSHRNGCIPIGPVKAHRRCDRSIGWRCLCLGSCQRGGRTYEPSGTFVAQFATGPEPAALAFNSTGSGLYVDAGSQIEEFDASGHPVIQTAGANAGISNVVDSSENAPLSVAVDPVTNDVYVYQRETAGVALFEASGAPGNPPGFAAGDGFSFGLAVDGLTGAVYVPEYPSEVVNVYQPVLLPAVVTGAASRSTETGTTLEGTVNPEGQPITSCEFEYGTDTSYGQHVSCEQTEAEIGSGDGKVAVSAAITGLQPDTTYHYRLVATNAEGMKYDEREYGDDREAATTSPPIVESESFSEVGSTQATLHARLNAAGSPSTYRFEYGTSASYGSPGSPTPPASFGEHGPGERDQHDHRAAPRHRLSLPSARQQRKRHHAKCRRDLHHIPLRPLQPAGRPCVRNGDPGGKPECQHLRTGRSPGRKGRGQQPAHRAAVQGLRRRRCGGLLGRSHL